MHFNFIRPLLLFVFCILLQDVSTAQQLLISPSNIDATTLGYTKVIGQDEEGYFVLTSNLSMNIENDRVGFKYRKYKLTYYTKALTLKWEKSIEPGNSDMSIDAVTFFNDNVVVTASLYTRSENKLSYYFTTINNIGEQQSSNKPVAEFSPVKNDYDKSKIIISQGREKLAIVLLEFTSDESQTLFASILDTSFTEQEQKSVVIPFAQKTFDISGYSLSDHNDLVVLGINSEKIKALSSKRKTDYYVYSSKAGQKIFKDFKVSGDKMITGLGVAFDNINNLAVLAGFYSDRDSYTGAGIYYASIDLNLNEELKVQTSAMDNQKNIRLRGERNNSGLSLIGYPIERIVLRNDGGAVLVAEAAYTTEYSYYDSFSQSFTRRLEYHFDNVVAISINSDGTVDWNAVVDKEQISMDDNGIYSSFCSLLNSENLVIVYNNDISKHNSIVAATIDNKGKLNKGRPIPGTEGLLLLPRSGKQVTANSILVPAYKKRNQFLVQITF